MSQKEAVAQSQAGRGEADMKDTCGKGEVHSQWGRHKAGTMETQGQSEAK